MAGETKNVKPRLDSDLQIRARAAMTLDASLGAEAVGIVMMADQAVDRRVVAMIEVQRQPLCTAQHRFAECDAGATRYESTERQQSGNDGTDDECRMTAER